VGHGQWLVGGTALAIAHSLHASVFTRTDYRRRVPLVATKITPRHRCRLQLAPVRPVGAPAIHMALEFFVTAGGDLHQAQRPVQRVRALGMLADPLGPTRVLP
jgi:hypothetical protein